MKFPTNKKELRKYLRESSLPTVLNDIEKTGLSVRESEFIILHYKKKDNPTKIVADKYISQSAYYNIVNCAIAQLLDYYRIKNKEITE